MRVSLKSATLSIFFSSLNLIAQDRIGEAAHYQLDKHSSRSSAIITDGFVDAKILELNIEGEVEVYKTQFDYKVKFFPTGSKDGTSIEEINAEFMNGEFFAEVKEKGEVQREGYKATYLRNETVKNLDGAVYEDCEIILFEGIDAKYLPQLFQAIPFKIDESSSIQVARKGGLPVMEIAKIDVMTKDKGVLLKAGFDYISQK